MPKKKTPRARIRRMIRRIKHSRVGVTLRRTKPVVTFATGIAVGFLLSAAGLAVRGHQLDWSFILVVITSVYVALTYLLVSTSVRQTKAAEENANLFRDQLQEERARQVGPIDALLLDLRDRISQWERPTDGSEVQDLPEILPPNFEETLQLSATVDLYCNHQLRRLRQKLEAVSTTIEHLRSRPGPLSTRDQAWTDLKSDLRRASSSIRAIRQNLHGWDENP